MLNFFLIYQNKLIAWQNNIYGEQPVVWEQKNNSPINN